MSHQTLTQTYKEAPETTSERIEISRIIPAPASEIFRTIASSQGHVAIDGSGMLLAATRTEHLTSVGDTFEINMDREPLGDVPLGKYTVVNTVTKIGFPRIEVSPKLRPLR